MQLLDIVLYIIHSGVGLLTQSCCCDMLPIFRLMNHVSVVVLVGLPYRHGVMVDGVTSCFNKIELMFLTAIVVTPLQHF